MTEKQQKSAKLCRRIALWGAIALIILAGGLSYMVQGKIVAMAMIAALVAAGFHFLAFTMLAKQYEIMDDSES